MIQRTSEELRVVSSNNEIHPETARIQNRHVAVEVKNATLRYPIGPYIRGSLKSNMLRLFGHREESLGVSYVEALKGLDLSVGVGERVGVIGSNGSGKSSFLRAIAGIYPLKAGSINVAGQVGTLLDVGLGFETESTGRENIYYRGMSMGYSRAQLKSVEQEIIDFADLGQFIDLPMRAYSTGMYVRLGFAVSTQFTPDVLLIDEVFGAGDANFAQKAVARMMDIVHNAGIMITATHDMSLVQRLCTRVLWFNRGLLVRDGPPMVVIPQYNQFVAGELEV